MGSCSDASERATLPVRPDAEALLLRVTRGDKPRGLKVASEPRPLSVRSRPLLKSCAAPAPTKRCTRAVAAATASATEAACWEPFESGPLDKLLLLVLLPGRLALADVATGRDTGGDSAGTWWEQKSGGASTVALPWEVVVVGSAETPNARKSIPFGISVRRSYCGLKAVFWIGARLLWSLQRSLPRSSAGCAALTASDAEGLTPCCLTGES